MVTDKVLLTREQKALLDGLGRTLGLFNEIAVKLVDSGLTVDATAWQDGSISVKIVRDVREIEIELGKGDANG